MSSEKSKAYREYALIQGINLLVNMVEQTKRDKVDIKDIYPKWVQSGILDLGDQIEAISGTAADGLRCRYLAFCINQLNAYMMSKYPNHVGLIRKLTNDILEALNMAIMGNAHIWTKAKLQSILAAFGSARVGKPTPYYTPEEKEEEEEKEKKRKERHAI